MIFEEVHTEPNGATAEAHSKVEVDISWSSRPECAALCAFGDLCGTLARYCAIDARHCRSSVLAGCQAAKC